MQEIPPKDHHRQIPHDADDKSAMLQQSGLQQADLQLAGNASEQGDKEISFFEKQIISIHHLMISKGYLPSLDAIRRAAEDVDGMFDTQVFSGSIPQFLRSRWPEYGERRVLAVEEVFFEMGFLTRESLQHNPDTVEENELKLPSQKLPSQKPPSQTNRPRAPYSPYINESAYPAPGYNLGDMVQVSAHTQPGHVRVPVYLFGKVGKIISFQGMFRNPADVAHFRPTVLQLPLYLVEFEFKSVWGEACPARCTGDKIRAEIYEPWLTQMTS